MSITELGRHAMSFLLSTGGAVFMGVLFLAALAGLFRAKSAKTRAVCAAAILCCLLYAGLLVWLSLGFGGSGGRNPVPTPF